MFNMAIAGIVFFLILILIAVYFSVVKQKSEKERENQSVIHRSGIYSIIRKSPRESINSVKPDKTEIRQYLDDKNVDIDRKQLSESDKEELIDQWEKTLEASLNEIEVGDKKGLEFYYYDFKDKDKICKEFIRKGNFITRTQIYRYPELIPPFHLGCKCVLKCHHGVEEFSDTTVLGLEPLIKNEKRPDVPDWKLILT